MTKRRMGWVFILFLAVACSGGCQRGQGWPIPPELREAAGEGGTLERVADIRLAAPIPFPAGTTVQYMEAEALRRFPGKLLLTLIVETPGEPADVAAALLRRISAVRDVTAEIIRQPPHTEFVYISAHRDGLGHQALGVKIGKGPRRIQDPETFSVGATGEATKMIITAWLEGDARFEERPGK